MTILATPPSFSSLQDDLVYTVSEPTHTSDPVLYPNYKFIGDVYVGSTLVARIKKVPDPITQIGIFNIGQIVRNYIATTFNPAAGAIVAQELGDGQFSLSVTMKFGEEYGFTAFFALVADSSRTYFNNYNGRLIGATSSITALANKIATNQPTTANLLLSNSYYFISYFTTNTVGISYTVTPSGSGSGFSGTITPSVSNEMIILNLSPIALNAAHPGTINAATTSYTVQVGSQTYTFKIFCEPQYQTYMIHFLNQYGGFESKVFSKVSRKILEIQRQDFGKLPFTVDASGVVGYKNANGVYNESRSVYSSQYTERLTLNSDLLTDQEYRWLSDLILSPMVFIEDGGYFFPCVISDTNYEPKKFINDDLTNLTMNVEFGKQLNAQFR
jgi:hypothetical protein